MRLYLFVRIQSSISDRISLIIISFSFYGALLLLPPPVMLSTQFVLHKPNWPNGRFWQKYNFASAIQGGRAPLKIPVTASSPFENGGLFAKHTPPAPTLTSSATVIPNGFDNYRRQSTPPAAIVFVPAGMFFAPAPSVLSISYYAEAWVGLRVKPPFSNEAEILAGENSGFSV